MKLLKLTVDELCGVRCGSYSFIGPEERPRDLVVLVGAIGHGLLKTIAALLEAARATGPAPHHRDWWAQRRGPTEARIGVVWRLSESEAACAGAPRRTFTSEWRFGPGDDVPREIKVDGVDGALSRYTRAGLAKYSHFDANRSSVLLGGPDADPLAEVLAVIARRDVAATRVLCQEGVGDVAWSTPDTFVALNRAIASVFPSLRLTRVACARGEAPVVCYRDGVRVELGRLAEAERDAIHIAAGLVTTNMRDGMVLVERPELHVPRKAHVPWLDWLASVATTNQLIVATENSVCRDAETQAVASAIAARATGAGAHAHVSLNASGEG